MHRVISGMMQVAALSSSQSTIVLGPGCPLVDHGSGLEEFSNEATSGPTRLQKERKNRVNGPTRTSDRIGTFIYFLLAADLFVWGPACALCMGYYYSSRSQISAGLGHIPATVSRRVLLLLC